MAIEVVSRGLPPSERWYRIECKSCYSILRFQKNSCKQHDDQREGTFYDLACPVCNDKIIIYNLTPETSVYPY